MKSWYAVWVGYDKKNPRSGVARASSIPRSSNEFRIVVRNARVSMGSFPLNTPIVVYNESI